MVVEGWLARAAAERPAHTAVQTPQGSLTYEQLHARARRGARELARRGVGRGDRVAIALPAGLEFAQALHACLLLGAAAVPVDLRLPSDARASVTGACTLIVDESLGWERAPRAIAGEEVHDLRETAVIIHTSGTTASPRPVELSYGNLLWSALGSAVALGRDPSERWLCAMPLSHVGGLSILVRSSIYATSAVLHERFEADRVLHSLRSEEVTLVSLVASMLARLLDAGLGRTSVLRCALTGGGPVPAELIRRAHAAGVPLGLTYGLTEAASQVTSTPVAEIGGTPASAGPPLFCTSVSLAADGEILVRGPTVSRGAVAADGWLHTGDLGTLDEHSRLHVSGRKSDTIITGGENVSPAEVEAALESHPGVLEAAVVGRSDESWGEAVTAIVVARSGEDLDLDALRAHCARELAAYKVPKRFTVTAEPLPRTASGKLLRRELR